MRNNRPAEEVFDPSCLPGTTSARCSHAGSSTVSGGGRAARLTSLGEDGDQSLHCGSQDHLGSAKGLSNAVQVAPLLGPPPTPLPRVLTSMASPRPPKSSRASVPMSARWPIHLIPADATERRVRKETA